MDRLDGCGQPNTSVQGEQKWIRLVRFGKGKLKSGSSNTTAMSSPPMGQRSCGRAVTAYLKYKCGHYWLTTWAGGTMLHCRSEIIDRYWNGGLSLMFRLRKGRFICGYALSDDGMLFRGELLDHCTDDEARRHARMLSDELR